MAKGNLFLGMGRGKIGDVVFYRMNGWQMSRVRNRTPKNPRTNEQLYQRAVIAQVMKSYSLGKEIFDHAFQGYTIGEGCMRRYNSVNARLLRSMLIDDIERNLTLNEQMGRFCAPKNLYPAPPIGLQVSEGTIEQTLFKTTETSSNGSKFYTFDLNVESRESTIAELLDNNGITGGDIFTFVAFFINEEKDGYTSPYSKSEYASYNAVSFDWLRFIVKKNISEETRSKAIKETAVKTIFDVEYGGNVFNYSTEQSMDYMLKAQATNIKNGLQWATGACIRSRLDIDLRSTEFLIPLIEPKWGITSSFVLEAWIGEITKVGTSELILEGGEEGITGRSNAVNIAEFENEQGIIEATEDAINPRTGKRYNGRRKS